MRRAPAGPTGTRQGGGGPRGIGRALGAPHAAHPWPHFIDRPRTEKLTYHMK